MPTVPSAKISAGITFTSNGIIQLKVQRSRLATQLLNPLWYTHQVWILRFIKKYLQGHIHFVSLSCIGDLQALLQHLDGTIYALFTITHSLFIFTIIIRHEHSPHHYLCIHVIHVSLAYVGEQLPQLQVATDGQTVSSALQKFV